MAYENLKAAIKQAIKQNGNQEITGNLLQSTLLNIINIVGEGATFAGIATTKTDPGTPEGDVFYLATEQGIYAKFGQTNPISNLVLGVIYKSGNNWIFKILFDTHSYDSVSGKINSLKKPFIILKSELDDVVENKILNSSGTYVDNKYSFSATVNLKKYRPYSILSIRTIYAVTLDVTWLFRDDDGKIISSHTNSVLAANESLFANCERAYIPIPENAATFSFSYYNDEYAKTAGIKKFDGINFYDRLHYGSQKNFTNNCTLENLIKEFYISDDSGINLDNILSVSICKATKVYKHSDNHYNGAFLAIGDKANRRISKFVLALTAYSNKEEALEKSKTENFFYSDGVFFIIDLNAVDESLDTSRFFSDVTDTAKDLKFSHNIEKLIKPSISQRDIFTMQTTPPSGFDTAIRSVGYYVQWKPINSDVIIKCVRFSNVVTDADKCNMYLIALDGTSYRHKKQVKLELVNNQDYANTFLKLDANDLLCLRVAGQLPDNNFVHYRKQRLPHDEWLDDYVCVSSLDGLNFSEFKAIFDISYDYTKIAEIDKIWKGLNGLFIGDSITWYGWYPDAIGNLTGCEVYNRGGDGTTIASYSGGLSFAYRSTLEDNNDKNAKVSGFPSKADKIFILGGINDWGYARRGGPNFKLGDIHSEKSMDSFAGAFKFLLSNIRNKYRNADIYVLLMYNVYTLSTSTLKHGEINLTNVDGDISGGHSVIKVTKDGESFTLDDMRDIESKIAKMYGCKVIDLREIGFSSFVESDRNHYFVADNANTYSGDGLHMNKIGSTKMAEYVLSQIL